jgi:Kef-type K+ transport system membrane component KefB
MLTTAGLCAIAYLDRGVSFRNVDFVRDALVLAACAAPSAPIRAEAWIARIGHRPAQALQEISRVDQVVALAVLGVVAIFFRPSDDATLWKLPSASAWLLVTLGLGGVLGIVTYVLIRGAKDEAEELALLLGAVALSAGMAGYLALSVPVVCAIAGALLANLPMRDKKGFQRVLMDVERPLYLIFLVVIGASWRPGEWQGWVIAPAFVLARVAGKRLGAIWARRLGTSPDLPSARHLAIALAPQSPIAVVAIVSAATLYRGEHEDRVRWAINAVIIGGVLTEVVVRILERVGRNALTTPLPGTSSSLSSFPPPSFPPPPGDKRAP